LNIDCSKVSQAKANDVLPEMAFPGIAVALRSAPRESLLAAEKKVFSTKSTIETPASGVKPILLNFSMKLFLSGMTPDFLG